MGATAVTDQVRAVLAGVAPLLPEVHEFYRDLHRHPELSGQEVRTSALVAQRLRAAGFEVTEGIGGYGVVGVLANGAGPVVALRGDLDALPVQEETGLPYASENPGVMHACGHDVHTACLTGVAKLLAGAREQVVRHAGDHRAAGRGVDQRRQGDARRRAVYAGSRAPTSCSASTTRSGRPARCCTAPARCTRRRATSPSPVHGKGAHGAAPNAGVDPVVIAALVILDLQTIVSREVSPNDIAVVTVGSVHAGTRPNIIPPSATLEITTRGANETMLDQIEEALRRLVSAACAGARSAPRARDRAGGEHPARR